MVSRTILDFQRLCNRKLDAFCIHLSGRGTQLYRFDLRRCLWKWSAHFHHCFDKILRLSFGHRIYYRWNRWLELNKLGELRVNYNFLTIVRWSKRKVPVSISRSQNIRLQVPKSAHFLAWSVRQSDARALVQLLSSVRFDESSLRVWYSLYSRSRRDG